jgi:hypothetical protein
MKKETIKRYIFSYLDKQSNVLKTEDRFFSNIKEAREHAKQLQSNSMLNDLHKIKVVRF